MEAHQRQLVLHQLQSSKADLLEAIVNLTPAQWHFRESPDRWSIAENLEHLILFEAFIRGAIEHTLANPAELEKKLHAAAKDPLVLNLASRDTRFTAREAARPTGRSSDPSAMIAEFQNSRAQTIAFAGETQAALRDHFFPHIVFGDLDCFQWLLVLGRHTLRHVRQVEQIKADPAYPARS